MQIPLAFIGWFSVLIIVILVLAVIGGWSLVTRRKP
jgi:hypothetical protein